MKTTTIAMLLAALIVPAQVTLAAPKEREDPKKEREDPRKEDPKKEEERKKAEKAEKERKRDAVKDFLKQKDGNKDGSVSKDEYLADESDKEAAGKKFDEFNKNGDRALAKSEIEALLGLTDK
ncbi:hypothetical protein [Luteolibacter soli]|uniref:EF-hand domain-containing protein n=1 Tax=Luteolibacter soli TaxID=3135280 RepID=A0ABU9AZF1_9BACT